MLIETQVVRSKSELMKELQGLPVTKAAIYRNVNRNSWEQIGPWQTGQRSRTPYTGRSCPVSSQRRPGQFPTFCNLPSIRYLARLAHNSPVDEYPIERCPTGQWVESYLLSIASQ